MKKLLFENMQRFHTKNMDHALAESKQRMEMYVNANMKLIKRNPDLQDLFESELINMFKQLNPYTQQRIFDVDDIQQLNQKLINALREKEPPSARGTADPDFNPRDTPSGRPSRTPWGDWTGD